MVAAHISLPNVRRFLVPDPGHLIVDMDLSGADAQVVAWEAGDDDLKAAFRSGLKVHAKNARDMFPERAGHLSDAELKKLDHPGGIYYECKRGIHATNYGGSPRGLAPRLKWTVRDTERFQSHWFRLHPGIRDWHDRTGRCLEGSQCWRCGALSVVASGRCPCGAALGRTIANAFGYRRIYFDRVRAPKGGVNPSMLREALAWVPQSTVAIVTQRGMLALEADFPFAQMLLQVHDSIVFQIPRSEESALPAIKERLDQIEVPYEDPLRIPWGLKVADTNWGDCE